nr:hypothetical protein [Tanacetum cinerariifolium]
MVAKRVIRYKGLAGFISLLEIEFTSSVKSLFYLVPGLDFHLGLKQLKYEADCKECVECGVNNDHVLHVYASHSKFDLNETTTEQNDNSESDLEDDDYNVYDYFSSKESDTASVDHFSDDEEEVLDLPRNDFDDSSDPKSDDQDKLGDHWPIHDPKIKWKLIRPHLGERSKENTKCVSAAGEELTAAKHKLIMLELKLFRDATAAAHMK